MHPLLPPARAISVNVAMTPTAHLYQAVVASSSSVNSLDLQVQMS